LNKLSAHLKRHVKTVVQKAQRRGDRYDDLYLQYVVIPGIVDKMSFKNRKMTRNSLLFKKGQKTVSGS